MGNGETSTYPMFLSEYIAIVQQMVKPLNVSYMFFSGNTATYITKYSVRFRAEGEKNDLGDYP